MRQKVLIIDDSQVIHRVIRARIEDLNVDTLDAFTGLSAAQIDAAAQTPVSFALRREAGEATFQGTFHEGKGGGPFTFTPHSAFLESVRALGEDLARRAAAPRPHGCLLVLLLIPTGWPLLLFLGLWRWSTRRGRRSPIGSRSRTRSPPPSATRGARPCCSGTRSRASRVPTR